MTFRELIIRFPSLSWHHTDIAFVNQHSHKTDNQYTCPQYYIFIFIHLRYFILTYSWVCILVLVSLSTWFYSRVPNINFTQLVNTIQPCDTNQARSDSYFGVKFSTVQFYAIEHNFKSNSWIELKLYQKIPEVFVYVGVYFQENPRSEKTCNIGPNRLYEFYYLLLLFLVSWRMY
jgi:hypothetical protein